jgi:thioredoxin 1
MPGISWCCAAVRGGYGILVASVEEYAMASGKVRMFTDQNFEQEVLKSPIPVLVDFTATWCGPCKALAPIIDQLAEELDGRVAVGKVDIDESPGSAGKYGVRGVPTVMVCKNGERTAQYVGLTNKQRLAQLIEQ